MTPPSSDAAPGLPEARAPVAHSPSRHLRSRFAALGRGRLNVHRPGPLPDVFLVSTPRSGSTWLMELVWSQPGFTFCDEPLNLRDPVVCGHLGFRAWGDLYADGALEPLCSYLGRIRSGALKVKGPYPFSRFHRFRTERVVFKIINGAEHLLLECARRLGAVALVLTRHPIPVTFSREVFPRIGAVLASPVVDLFEPAQIRFARETVREGDHFRVGVVSWCLQNALFLREDATVPVITYEQLVVEPAPVLDALAEWALLPEPRRMHEMLETPSRVLKKSDERTRSFLADDRPAEDRSWLIRKWTDRAGPEHVAFTGRALDAFGITLYRADDPMPAEHGRIRSPQHPHPAGPSSGAASGRGE